jgi:dihydropyrimidine dehydrogenase (NAD+) subunit PreT
LPLTRPGHLRELHGTVVVVGAGNTAIDAANAARRLGARRSICSTGAASSEMSAFDFEYEHAKQEGVQFLWRRQPVAIRPEAHGRLLLETVQVRQVDRKLEPIPDSQYTIECDLVVPAIGQSPLTELLQELRGVEVRDGRIVADRATGQTGNPRYFAGGDCVNGGREVVDAVAGRQARCAGDVESAEVAHA